MQNQTHVDRASCSMRQEGFEAKQSIEPDRPRNTWKFVGDFQQMMGEDAEPDSLFFVESWTLGVPEAVASLRKRRLEQLICERKASAFCESNSFEAPLFVTDKASHVEFVSSTGAPEISGVCNFGKWQEPFEDHAMKSQGQTMEETDTPTEEADRTRDSTQPITRECACELLGVTASSTRQQIKTAYRQTVAQWHPDRFENRGREVRQIATQKMAAINEAYRLLRDDRA